ncbi:MAG: phage major capsid protein [Rhodobacter sp.]|nr:phage major capsid protein [Rhodobacter sp.]MCA3493720.1 phage major capsid protein [Rhodobacter sp.]MCA3500085.1 phage major capsid protein [Rhodobacter sp.]MCA3502152.1 phage major capsid protein [Rhodobacter sp.]MCA3517531.1 phage major capsid protein [Rhodobacter sp.]
MGETSIRSGAQGPEAGGPAEQMTRALAGFLQEFNGFQAEVTSALHQQEERLTMLQAKTMTYGRPVLSTAVDMEEPHKKAFNAYLRHGDDEGLRSLMLEGKALSTAVPGDGGFLVDPRTADTVKSMLVATGSIRSIASVVTVDATSFDVLIDRSDVGTGWVTETGSVSETATPLIERISIRLHQLAAMPKASQRLLDDSAFDVEGWLAEKIASRFIRSESAAFVNGDGVDKPKGFLLPAKVANSTWTWGSLGYVASGAAADFPTTNAVDCIVNLVYALAAPYRANATFVMNSKTAGAVRKMKDADGRFMWADGLAVAEPPRLMGYPVLICEDMPDIAANAHAIAFGDFAAGYTIAERTDLRILRDPFSAKPHVLFYATKRVGGDISDYAAIKLLKFALS